MALLRRSGKLKWVARLHFWVMFFSFVLYLGFGFVLGPEFLYQDIRKKFFAFADEVVVTATVPGPPAAPTLTATPTCVSSSPRIVLDWADDNGSTSWDIDRDSLPLTTGLVLSQYTDTAVIANTSYTYQATAYGPMSPGIAIGGTVSATTLDCASIVPVTVSIETLGGRNVTAGNRTNINFSKRRPKVTGTTNTPNAIIDIVVTGPTISARTVANANGYFEWIPPIGIDTGSHSLTVTATDPADGSRTGSDSFTFWTENSDSGDGSAGGGTRTTTSGSTTQASATGDFDFSVVVKNSNAEAFHEDILVAEIVLLKGLFPEGAFGRIFLNGMNRQDVLTLPETGLLYGMEGLTFETLLPPYLDPGEYRIRVDIFADGEVLSREATLELKGVPILSIGGHDLFYVDVASYIGTMFFSLLFTFLTSLTLFVREYWLTLHSLRGITAAHLVRFVVLGTRKGVIR